MKRRDEIAIGWDLCCMILHARREEDKFLTAAQLFALMLLHHIRIAPDRSFYSSLTLNLLGFRNIEGRT